MLSLSSLWEESEVFRVFFVVSTDCASKHFFISIWSMISSNRAFSRPLTFWQLLSRIFWHIIAIALFLMTRLTEMSIAPTKPLSSRTTELTLELNEVNPMFGAVFYRNVATFWAHEFLLIESLLLSILIGVHYLGAVLSASKIWLFALKTHKVCVDGHCVLLWFVVVWWVFVNQFFVFFAFLEFQSFERHFLDQLVKLFHLFDCLVKFIFWRNFNPLFAQRTNTETEQNSWSEPLNLESLFNALEMENMSTSTLDRWRGIQPLSETNGTKVISRLSSQWRLFFTTALF